MIPLFRASMILLGPFLLLLWLRGTSAWPLPAILFALGIGVGTFLMGLWPRPWTRFVLFVADESGIAFPANDLLVVKPGAKEDTRWLHVPWRKTSNVRVLTEKDVWQRLCCINNDNQLILMGI